MCLEKIQEQARAVRMLQSGLKVGRLSHAYLFHGPKGTGKRRTARAFAQAIFCPEREADACGTCLECRKFEHGNHAGIQWIQPDGQSVKIEQIRELRKDFAYKSDRKVYVIDPAEAMTLQAANSLLKFLEEPETAVTALLITENRHALLPTVLSRCQSVPFLPASPAVMADKLLAEGLPKAAVLPAVHLASGLEMARELAASEQFAEIRKVMIQLAKEGRNSEASASLALHRLWMKPGLADRSEDLLALFILLFKDFIHILVSRRDRLVFMDEEAWLERQARTRPAAFWASCMEKAVETRKRLRANANPQLALERFMFEVQGG